MVITSSSLLRFMTSLHFITLLHDLLTITSLYNFTYLKALLQSTTFMNLINPLEFNVGDEVVINNAMKLLFFTSYSSYSLSYCLLSFKS
jgi:hypothetical protein